MAKDVGHQYGTIFPINLNPKLRPRGAFFLTSRQVADQYSDEMMQGLVSMPCLVAKAISFLS